MTRIRPPSQAGKFYPEDPTTLAEMVDEMMEEARGRVKITVGRTVAFIVPHAGYVYSGPIAASAYAVMERQSGPVERVILLGPSHWADFRGFALSEAEGFATPLGVVPVDVEANELLVQRGVAFYGDSAHLPEHCLEVQLPFLQRILDSFQIVPILVGRADPNEVGILLDTLNRTAGTVILVSSDLSHYLDYETAVRVDRATAEQILRLDWRAIHSEAACGYRAIRGLLHYAGLKGWRVRLLDLRNSGDTAGPADRVVGYGAFAFEQRGGNS